MWCGLLLLGGCKSTVPSGDPAEALYAPATTALQNNLLPSNHRNWSPDLAVLPYAVFEGDQVTIHNIRDCSYHSDDDYVVRHYDKTFDLDELESVDFMVVPFKGFPSLAHTMLSFGFADGDQLGVSVEARLEEGEDYSPLMGSLRQFELMYVVADERDLIVRRTKHRDVDVFLYETVATPQQSRELLEDVLRRVNKLYSEPEFYDTVANNCTTNIARHINRLRPGRVPYELRIALPGFSDHLAYELGLLKRFGSFQATRERARVTSRANQFAERRDFSSRIRR
jgi:hypothetical protein